MLDFLYTETLREKIGDTEVIIKVFFRRYPPEVFKFDLELLEKLYNKEWKNSAQVPSEVRSRLQQVSRYEIFFRNIVRKHFPKGTKVRLKADYPEFQKFASGILSRKLFDLIKNILPGIIAGQPKVTITLHLLNKYVEGYLASHVYEHSSAEQIKLEISGSALVGRIYFPWLYTKRVDPTFLERTLVHELEHHLEHRKGLYQREEETLSKIKDFMKLNPESWKIGFPELVELFCNLYTEGLATFVESRRSNYVAFELPKIRGICGCLEKISQAKEQKEVKDLLEKELRANYESGEYYLGHLMCYFIGLNILRKKRKDFPFVQIHSQGKLGLPFVELNKFLQRYPMVKLEQLDKETFQETYEVLSKLTHYQQFFQLYAEACRELKLSEPVLFLSPRFYLSLLDKAAPKHKTVRETLLNGVV